MNIQHVHRQIVSRQLHRVEHLSERHHLAGLRDGDDLIGVLFQRLLDEAQQMFLVHTAGCMDVSIHLADVVEVAMRNRFLRCQLAQLVQQHVQLVLRVQIAQAAIAEGLQRPVGDHRAHRLHVLDELRHHRARVVELVVRLLISVHLERSLLRLDGVVEVLGEFELPRVEVVRRVHRMF